MEKNTTMFNKKYLVVFIVLLVAMMTVSVAADVNNTNTKAKVTKDTSKVTNTQKIVKTTENTKKIKTNNKDNITSKKTNSKTKTEVKKNTTSKKVKKESESVDLYVSDTMGSDTNSGTSDKPFKTLQKAIDKTISGSVNNIHINEGTYKGVGNTNLTVNGNNKINFIGDDVNKTVFDGEASYEINTADFHWGSSDIWSFYVREKGNYFMKISSGNGQIKLSDITIQNMYSPGGDRISLYPHTTVDNYANLIVNNTRFISNHGGVGSAIRNNNGATLIVDNSYFRNNSKSSSTGNDGIIYNNGTATITNSLFDHNYARWGTILNDKNLEVINSTLKNNIGYDGTSTYKYGTGIAFNTGNGDYNNLGFFLTHTNITGCTFINNDQTDIYGYAGNLIAKNNQFTNSTGIYIIDSNEYDAENKYESYNLTYNIEDNTFEKMKVSTLLYSMSTTIDETNAIQNTHAIYAKVISKLNITNNIIKSKNTTLIEVNKAEIRNNILNVENGIAIRLFGSNNLIENNNINTQLNLNNTNNVTSNTIITSDDYSVNIQGTKNIVKNNKLYSARLKGDESVNNPGDNTVQDNGSPFPENSIFVGQNITTPDIGTLTNPTTIEDALSKLEENGTIYLVKGTNTTFSRESPIIISPTTVKENTYTINIIGYDENITFNGNNKTQIINITAGYTVNIHNLTFTNANGNNGGAITNNGTLNIENSIFTDNYGIQSGASIYNLGTLTINGNTLFINEKSGYMGGAIDNRNILTINGNNQFINCESKNGGAIYSIGILNITGENDFINNSAKPTAQRQGGGAIFCSSNLTIKGKNNFINNTASGSTYVMGGAIANYINYGYSTFTVPYVVIEGENYFFNNKVSATSRQAFGGAVCVNFAGTVSQEPGECYTLLNGSNIFVNNSAVAISSAAAGSLYSYYDLIIEGNNKFYNSSSTENGGAIYSDRTIVINGNNIFENCTATSYGGAITTFFIESNGNKFINCNSTDYGGVFYIWGFHNDDYGQAETVIINGTEIVNASANNGGVITFSEWTDYADKIKITNNIFTNVISNNETLNLFPPCEKIIKNNTYNNCSIGLNIFTISSIFEDQTIPQNTPIPVTINTQLIYPEYYDADILDKITYKAYVNDIEKYEVKNNQFTVQEAYTDENQGILNIYAKIAEDTQSNTITVNLIKPLDTSIEITTPNENTVNKTTPITIILKDENGQLVQGVEVTISTENKNETITLENGVIVYQYTPTTVGTETITVTYTGNSTLNPSNQTATLKVTVNKDEVIEELTNTTQEQEKTITKQENTIKEEQKKVETLNKTVETQKQNIEKLEEKVEKLTEKTKTKLTISKATATVGKKVTIKVTVKDANGKAVTGGKVSLKVNGKVLKDSNNNIIYADVSKGVASIKYLVPGSWIKQNPKIQAIYTGNDKYADSTVIKTKLVKVNKGFTTITLTPNIKSTKAGSKVIITVKHVDTNTKKGLTSKVAVKVNGKTFKVKVKNGEGVLTYTVPAGMNAKTVKVTASHSSKYYNKATSKTSFKVTKTTPTIKTTKTTYKSKKSTIKGKILDANNKVLTKNVKVTVKVDGKVVLKNKVVKKGKINLSFKKSLKKGYHELVITSKATKAFNKASFTGVLKV